ncbi:MAG: hypothetical protein K6B65_07360 [Bacilli bacterium]|nr:hypothetical protein [Bacilli bacterium]
MKKNQFLPISATLLLGAMAALSSCGCSTSVVSYEIKAVDVILAKGGDEVSKIATTGLLFKNKSDIAYAIPELFFSTQDVTITESNDVYTYTNPAFKMVIDTNKDTVAIDNYDGLVAPTSPKKNKLVPYSEFLAYDDDKSTTEKKNDTLTYDLAKYGFDAFTYEIEGKKQCFAPLTPMAALMNGGNCITAYNGTQLFMGLPNALINEQTGQLTKAGEAYYGGSFNTKKSYSKEFSEYNYNCLAFAFDNFNSYGEEIGVKDFRKYFKEKGVEADLLSTDPDTVSHATAKVMYGLLDEGHNGYTTSSFKEKGVIKSKNEGSTLARDYAGPRDKKLIEAVNKMYEYKKPYLNAEGAYPFYQTSGSTAMIYFPSFVASNYTAQEKSPEGDISTTYGIFYNGFKRAAADSNIKNVVINIADNNGGDAAALVQTLGFLAKDGVAHVTDKTYNTSSYSNEYYAVDTNADGKFDSSDGYGSKFDNIFILESYVSFSCANALPYYAKNDGTAKIIGQTSGGGHAVVNNFFLPTGDSICYSGNNVLGAKNSSGTFVSNDKGATPDHVIEDMSIAFDVAKVAKFVEGLAK